MGRDLCCVFIKGFVVLEFVGIEPLELLVCDYIFMVHPSLTSTQIHKVLRQIRWQFRLRIYFDQPIFGLDAPPSPLAGPEIFIVLSFIMSCPKLSLFIPLHFIIASICIRPTLKFSSALDFKLIAGLLLITC